MWARMGGLSSTSTVPLLSSSKLLMIPPPLGTCLTALAIALWLSIPLSSASYDLYFCLSTERDVICSALRDDEAAYSATQHGRPELNLKAPTKADYDTLKGRGWALMSHACVYSTCHHDAGGLCTWIQVLHGCKVWGFMRAQEAWEYTNGGAEMVNYSMSRVELERFNGTIAGAIEPTHSRLLRSHIFLVPGDILYVFPSFLLCLSS